MYTRKIQTLPEKHKTYQKYFPSYLHMSNVKEEMSEQEETDSNETEEQNELPHGPPVSHTLLKYRNRRPVSKRPRIYNDDYPKVVRDALNLESWDGHNNTIRAQVAFKAMQDIIGGAIDHLSKCIDYGQPSLAFTMAQQPREQQLAYFDALQTNIQRMAEIMNLEVHKCSSGMFSASITNALSE